MCTHVSYCIQCIICIHIAISHSKSLLSECSTHASMYTYDINRYKKSGGAGSDNCCFICRPGSSKIKGTDSGIIPCYMYLPLKLYFKGTASTIYMYPIHAWELIYPFDIWYMPWDWLTPCIVATTSVAMVFTISSQVIRHRITSILPIYYFWSSFQVLE